MNAYLEGKCMQQAQQADELLTPFIIAVRKELNTPFNEEVYRGILKVSHERSKKNLEACVSCMRAKFGKFLDMKKTM